MLRNKYRAFEIRDDQVSQTLVDGNLCSIAEFIRHCSEGSIITLHTMEGEPFLIGLSKMFVFCGDKAFLDRQLIPYLRSMDGKAVIDCMFQKEELVSFVKELGFLEHVFREGVYDRLSEGGGVKETAEVSIGEGRRLRIYQLGQDSPIMMRFISLAERKKRGYDRPRREEYVRVYEGEIENYSLEEVWEKYGRRVPEGFQGHALSISDVIEFADGENSRFFYIEPSGYEEIRF